MNDTSINQEELAKFAKLSDRWWDIHGPFKTLHEINPVRLKYIKNIIGEDISKSHLLDLGCGGGILSLPLARIAKKVTAIDASSENIEAAKMHAKSMKVNIDFISTTIENHSKTYDSIICLELLEHVDNLEKFLGDVVSRLKKGGRVIFSTLNRNPKSFLLAIGMAEYVLRWVPRGTHDYSKFIKPSELTFLLENHGIEVEDISGMSYNPLNGSWRISDDPDVNYFLSGVKK